MKRPWVLTLLLAGTPFLVAASCGSSSFTLSNPPSANLQQGQSINLELKIQPANGFASAVALKIGGLPEGISASFDPVVVQPGTVSTLRLTAATGAKLGATKLSLLGEAGNASATSSVDLTVALPKNYVEIAAPSPNDPAKVVRLPVLMEGGVGVYQGDILFPAAQVVGANANQISTQGTVMQPGYCHAYFIGCIDRAHLWPNKTVPYAFHPSATAALRALVQQAAQVYLDRADIRLIPRTNQDDYVLVRGIPTTSTEGGSSPVGRLESEQDLNLRTDASLGTVLHEFGHALGLWHEMSRPDRDQYVEVLHGNVNEKFEHNFELKDDPDVARANGPYDFGSIMHYPLNAFSKNGQPTIRVKNPAGVDVSQIGQRTTLSAGDILALADLYNAPVTAGSIKLRLSGNSNLISGGTRSLYIDVVNAGPRNLQDLYFAISMPSFVAMNAGAAGLQCGAPTGGTAVCYTPGGIASNAIKTYGPIRVSLPTGYTTGTFDLNLALRPIGTRLADPTKAVSRVRLCNINPRPDPGEYDSFANPLARLQLDENPTSAAFDVPMCDKKFSRSYTLHDKNDVDYFEVDASDASNRKIYEFSVDGGPSHEIYDSNGQLYGKAIDKPGKYILKVFGTEASLYTVNMSYFDPVMRKALSLADVRFLPKLDPRGPIVKRFIKAIDGFGMSNKDLSYFTTKGAGLVVRLFDAENKLVFEEKSNADNFISMQLPGSDGEQFFRAELGRQVSEETINGITVENPEMQYELTGYGFN